MSYGRYPDPRQQAENDQPPRRASGFGWLLMLGLMAVMFMSLMNRAQQEPATAPPLPSPAPEPQRGAGPFPRIPGGPLDQAIPPIGGSPEQGAGSAAKPPSGGIPSAGTASGQGATKPLEGTQGDWSIEEVKSDQAAANRSGVTLRLPAQPAVPKRLDRTEKGDWSIEEVKTQKP
jgi:hypothetical protein